MAADEKRLYPRLALEIEDGYFGQFRLANDDRLAALIVNLSAGGINIAVAESASDRIKNGDILNLQNISGGTSFSFLKNLRAEIRWIKKLEIPGYVSVGCRFIDISDDLREQLSRFVRSERMTRGQYD
jgi:c-di-GMP-binding flagellar brake protein YcgR